MEDTDQCRINTLPDSVLLQILSHLPIKSAVKTSVLSRRWRNLWSSIPILNFNEFEFSSNMKAQLVTLIDRFLLHHVGGVKSFNLSVNFSTIGCNTHLNRWISHLATRKVEEVRFLVHGSWTNMGGTRFPPECQKLRLNSFDCSSIVALELKGCYFDSPLNGNAVLGSLKTLSLRDMTLSGARILSMLQGCPALESLNMEKCSWLGDVKISSLHLLSLTIISCKDIKLLEIDAPHLQYFKFHCHLWKLDEGGFSKLLEVLTHLKVLKACGCFLQALSIWEDKFVNHQFSNLEELILLECERKDFGAKISYLLLKFSPHLRTTIINSEQCCGFLSSHNSHALTSSPVFQLPQLQNLNIKLFNGTDSEIKLLEYFVNNAPLLESMNITLSSRSKNMWSFVTNAVLLLQRGRPFLRMNIFFVLK